MDIACMISFLVSVLGLRVLTASPLATTTTDRPNRSNGRVLVRLEEKIRGMEAMTYALKLSRMEFILEQLSRRVENVETKVNSIEFKLDAKLDKIEQAISGMGRHGQINHQAEYMSDKLMNKLSSIEARINVRIDNLNSKFERNERKMRDSLADIAGKSGGGGDGLERSMRAQSAKLDEAVAEVNQMHSFVKEELIEHLSKKIGQVGTKVDERFHTLEQHVETEIHLLKDVKHSAQNVNGHLQRAIRHIESGSNASCTPRARGGAEPRVHDDPHISNLTDVMMASMRFGERKFKELDDDMELYTRKVLNTYQELLKSFREREEQVQHIIRDSNNTRSAVNEAFRRLHQQIRPFTAMQTKMEEMVDGLHHKISELDATLDSSFASLLIAQNTFITSCHRIQVQEPQIEHKIYALLQQIVNKNTNNSSRTNKDTSDNLTFSLLNNHHLQMGRALNDLVWTVLRNGNQTRDDLQSVVNKINSLRPDSSPCMVKRGEWDSLSKACDAVKKSRKPKPGPDKVGPPAETALSEDRVGRGEPSIVPATNRRGNAQRTKSQAHTFMSDEGNANERIAWPNDDSDEDYEEDEDEGDDGDYSDEYDGDK